MDPQNENAAVQNKFLRVNIDPLRFCRILSDIFRYS